MAGYDYLAGKDRIKEILNNRMEIKKPSEIPIDQNFTFENGYYCWISAIFVDIRESSALFSDEDKEKVAKIIRSFTSEVIDIMKSESSYREIGIRGDCVYGIYTTPTQQMIRNVAEIAFYINTFMGMLNQLLEEKKIPTIRVGIGVASDQELVIKAGRKNAAINSKVWIGDAVTKAANLSSLGSKKGLYSLCFSPTCYDNFIELLKTESADAPNWFTQKFSQECGSYYNASIIIGDFDKWIDKGMPELK